jgi:hypothetical protein
MESDNLCPNTLTVLSLNESVNINTGAFQCMGGAAIKKNLHVGKELLAKQIISETFISSGGDIRACGFVIADKMYTILDDSIIFNYNIEPCITNELVRRSLGSKDRKWEMIYGKNIYSVNIDSYDIKANNLDIKNQVSLGNNNGDAIISINSDNNLFCVYGSLVYLDEQKKPRLILKDNLMENDLLLTQTNNIKKMIDSELELISNTILLDLDELKKNYRINLHVDNNITIMVEIIIISNKNKITIDILGNKLTYIGSIIRLISHNGNIIKIN